MADACLAGRQVNSREIRSKNNLSRLSGWQPLKARKQSPKCWFAVSYIPMDFVISFTIKASPVNLILPASPLVRLLPKYKTVILVHACPPWRGYFWHGHEGCKYYVAPKTRTEWWLNKINGNIANDKKASKALKKEG